MIGYDTVTTVLTRHVDSTSASKTTTVNKGATLGDSPTYTHFCTIPAQYGQYAYDAMRMEHTQ